MVLVKEVLTVENFPSNIKLEVLLLIIMSSNMN